MCFTWKWLSHLETLWGLLSGVNLLSWLVVLVVAVGGTVISIVQGASPLVIWFSSLGSIVLGLGGVSLFTWIRRAQPTPTVEKPPTKQDIGVVPTAVPALMREISKWITEGENYARGISPGLRSNELANQATYVNRWIGYVEDWAWKKMPTLAPRIMSNEGFDDKSEMMRYSSWNRGPAELTIQINRRLSRLREAKSKLQAVDKEGSQSG